MQLEKRSKGLSTSDSRGHQRRDLLIDTKYIFSNAIQGMSILPDIRFLLSTMRVILSKIQTLAKSGIVPFLWRTTPCIYIAASERFLSHRYLFFHVRISP